jgi:hypothetical protein
MARQQPGHRTCAARSGDSNLRCTTACFTTPPERSITMPQRGIEPAVPADAVGLVVAHCRAARDADCNVSDACARMAGCLYQRGPFSASATFASTGTIRDPDALWRELFPRYATVTSLAERLVADMLRRYLTTAGHRGPVPGWSELYL